MTTIKNWTIVKAAGKMFLKGNVYGHPNKEYAEDGDLILTSAILHGGDGVVHCVDGDYIVE
jgi:hypothetical protein